MYLHHANKDQSPVLFSNNNNIFHFCHGFKVSSLQDIRISNYTAWGLLISNYNELIIFEIQS